MNLEQALGKFFGLQDFRPGQRQVVEAALNGRDALVVMPTGAGKSLCYQLPALMRNELTIIVSPLISLMQDQLHKLLQIAPRRVALLNSQQTPAENQLTLDRACAGDLRLLYLAPERLNASGIIDELAGCKIGLFVVDEAHCISEWGYDFRPDYLALGQVAEAVGARAKMALTATATPAVARDIKKLLKLKRPATVSTTFDRPNLYFAVDWCRTRNEKHQKIAHCLTVSKNSPAIVYTSARARAEYLAAALSAYLEQVVLPYHAGLERVVRAQTQARFMGGEVPVVVATSAFGMGVDKSDVRTVLHETPPTSLEAYYQEAGRAGRDGQPAECVVFTEQRDQTAQRFQLERQQALSLGQRVRRWRRLQSCWNYLQTSHCRRRALLRYFGEYVRPTQNPQGFCCDNCAGVTP